MSRRSTRSPWHRVLGLLCQAFSVARVDNSVDLCDAGSELRLETGRRRTTAGGDGPAHRDGLRSPNRGIADPGASTCRATAPCPMAAGRGGRGQGDDRPRSARRRTALSTPARRPRPSPASTAVRSRFSNSRSIRARLAAAAGFPPGRRLAEALEPSTDPVIVARGLEETSQTRAFVAEHPGAGIGGSKDIGPWIERAARGGRLDPAPLPRHRLPRSRPRPAWARRLSGDRRPLLRDLAREIHALPSLRNVLAAKLRSGRRAARHRLAAPRRPAPGRQGRLRAPAEPAGPVHPLRRAGRLAAGADRHPARRPVRHPDPGRGARPRQGDRPRRLRQRPDPVRGAARRRRARATPGVRPSWPRRPR